MTTMRKFTKGKKVCEGIAAAIYEMRGDFDGYFGVVIDRKLEVVTPSWADAEREFKVANLRGGA